MPLSPTEILTIVHSLQASSWDEAVITVGDSRITLARHRKPLPAASVASSSEPASGGLTDSTIPAVESHYQPEAAPATLHDGAAPASATSELVVTAPSVGVFLRTPQPGADSFVEVGQLAKVGDTLGIVAVLKSQTNILADVDGLITAIHVDHEGAVEFGTPLVSIKPEA